MARLLAPVVATILLVGCATVQPPEAAGPAAIPNGSFTAELNAHALHYEVHGSGPVLMTVPNSWGLTLEGLRGLYRPLEEHLTMVYFDPRGMGGSGPVAEPSDMGLAAVREDFHALRRHLGLERVHAIGWSNGAVNLIWLAHEDPETLASAIFVHGMASFGPEDMQRFAAAHPDLMQRWMTFQQQLLAPDLSSEERTARQKRFWMEEYFPVATADPARSAPVLAAAFADAGFSWEHARFAEEEAPTFDARAILAEIPVRSLVIAGAHDMLPPEVVRELHEGLPSSEFAVFEGSGHFAPVEEPEAFRALVLRFLGVAEVPVP